MIACNLEFPDYSFQVTAIRLFVSLFVGFKMLSIVNLFLCIRNFKSVFTEPRNIFYIKDYNLLVNFNHTLTLYKMADMLW